VTQGIAFGSWQSMQTSCGAHFVSCSVGIKHRGLGLETDHSFPSSAELKTTWSYTHMYLSHVPLWHGI